MAMPTTVLQFWTDEVARLTVASAATAASLQAATAAVTNASAAFTARGKEVTTAKDALDDARRKLAAIPMPADGDPLLAAMRDALIAWRTAASALVAADADFRRARAWRQQLSDRVAEFTSRLAAAKAELTAADAAAKRRNGWVAAVGTPPLADLSATADAALTSFQGNAKTKVEGDFPTNADAAKSFLARVRARRALAAEPLKQATDGATAAIAVNTAWDEATTRDSAKTAARQRAFEAAVTDLFAFVSGPQRVAQASAALKALAERPASPLTPAQHADLHTGDAALETQREDALAKLKARDDAQAALFAGQVTYANALFAAQSADPDKSEADLIAANAALAATHDALAPKQADLAASEGALAADLPVLQAWLAAVPDVLWDQLDALDTALADLNWAKAAVPADLVDALQHKERDLAENLDASSKERRRIDALRAGLARQQAGLADESELAPRRSRAATRFVAEV